MTMPDLKELREKAEVAMRRDDSLEEVIRTAKGSIDFKMVNGPATILALLDRIESAEKIVDALAFCDLDDSDPFTPLVRAARAHFQTHGGDDAGH